MNKKDFEIRTEIIKETFNDTRHIICHIPIDELELDKNIRQEGDFFLTEDGGIVDLEFQFEYGADYDEVKAAILDILKKHPQVIQGPVEDSTIVAEPWVGLIRLGDSGVSVVTRSWCKGPDYWAVYFNLNETVYQMLKERGFMFPFNRVDVNILNNK